MASKLFMNIFLLIPPFLFVGCHGQGLDEFIAGVTAELTADGNGNGPISAMPCIQKLLPCEPFLSSPNAAPSPACCVPLKEMINGGSACLCNVFDNPSILQSFNITQDQALALPKACGASANISVCKNAASPGAAPETSAVPHAPPTPTDSSDNSPTPSSATGIFPSIGSFVVAFLLASIPWAF